MARGGRGRRYEAAAAAAVAAAAAAVRAAAVAAAVAVAAVAAAAAAAQCSRFGGCSKKFRAFWLFSDVSEHFNFLKNFFFTFSDTFGHVWMLS